MAEDTRKILIDVQVKLDQLTETRKQIDALKEAQKSLGKITDENRTQNEIYSQQIRILNTELKNQQKEIDNTVKLQKSESESMKALEAQASLMTEQYKKMSKEQRNSAEGVALKNSINDIKKSLNGANEGIGNFQAQVGNYKNKIQEALGINTGFTGSLVKIGEGGKEVGVTMLKEGAEGVKAFGTSLLKLLSNPIVAILATIAATVMLIVGAMQKNGEVAKNVGLILAPFKAILESVVNIFTSLVKVITDGVVWLENMTITIAKHIPFLNKLAEKAEESIQLKKEEQELNKKIRDQIIESAKEELEIAELKNKSRQRDKYSIAERLKFLQDAGNLEIKKSNEISDNAKTKFELKKKQMIEEGKTYSMLTSEEKTAYRQMEADILNAEKERFTSTLRIRAQESTLIKEEQALRSKIANDNIDLTKQENLTRLDLAKKYFANENKSDAENKSISFKKLQKYNKDVFILEQNAERQKLKNQLYIKDITDQEYNNSLEKLRLKYKVFLNDQSNDEKQFLIDRRKEIISIAGKIQDDQITDVKLKYKSMHEDIKKDSNLNEIQKYYYTIRLKKKEVEEVNNIEINGIKSKYSEITTNLDNQYENELLLAKNNKRATLELYSTLLEDKLKQAKQAQKDNENADEISRKQYEKDVIKAQNDLNDNKESIQNLNLQTELNNARSNDQLIYETKVKFLKKELVDKKGNADEISRINKELADLEISEQLRVIAKRKEIANEIIGIANNIATVYKNREDSQVKITDEANTKKKESLQAKLDAGIITQKKYDNEVKKLDAEADKQKAIIARKQALRSRNLSLAQVIINTIESESKTFATLGYPAGIPAAILAGVVGTAETAAIMSTEIPKASKGMLINGKSHAQGGQLVEAEGGEIIINKRSSQAFRSQLSDINEWGGGVKFANGGVFNDGGYSVRNSIQASQGITKSEMIDIISSQRIYVAVEDIRKGDKKYSDIESGGKY